MGRRDAVQFTLEWAARARALGATVDFEPGWETRGNGTSANYEGGVVHHTASPSSAGRPFPTRTVLIGGRPDLSGPLCNVAGPYCEPGAPRLVVISANPANHAGASGGKSMGPLPVTSLFNPRVFGLEIDYAGASPMSSGQYRAALIFARALADVLGRSTEYVRGHAETSITGKWDPGFATGKTIDLAAFRRDAATFSPTGGFLSMLNDAQQAELFAKVQSIYAWLRGGDPKLDNVSLLWMADNSQTAALKEIKSILLGSTPADGDRLFDTYRDVLAAIAALDAKLGQDEADTPAAAVDSADPVAIAQALASNPVFIDAIASRTASEFSERLSA